MIDPERYRRRLLAIMIAISVIFFLLGDFIGCYNMVGGSSDWCEPVIQKFGL